MNLNNINSSPDFKKVQEPLKKYCLYIWTPISENWVIMATPLNIGFNLVTEDFIKNMLSSQINEKKLIITHLETQKTCNMMSTVSKTKI